MTEIPKDLQGYAAAVAPQKEAEATFSATAPVTTAGEKAATAPADNADKNSLIHEIKDSGFSVRPADEKNSPFKKQVVTPTFVPKVSA